MDDLLEGKKLETMIFFQNPHPSNVHLLKKETNKGSSKM